MEDEELMSLLYRAISPATCQIGNILQRNGVPCPRTPLVREISADDVDVEHAAQRSRFRLRQLIEFRKRDPELGRCLLRLENGMGSHVTLTWHGTTRRWTCEISRDTEQDPVFDAMLARTGMPRGSFFHQLEDTHRALGVAFRMTALFMAVET